MRVRPHSFSSGCDRAIGGALASTARYSATAATPTPTTSPRRPRWRRTPPRACSWRSTMPGSRAAAIGHVNTHGTSTPLNDTAEAEASCGRCSVKRAAGHVDEGRDGWHLSAPPARPRRSRRLLAFAGGTVPPAANLERLGDDIALDVVAGGARVRSRRRRRPRTRSVSAATTPRWRVGAWGGFRFVSV